MPVVFDAYDSSDTLSDTSDAESSPPSPNNDIQPGREPRREHRDIELWTPGGDRDPWEFRSGTKDRQTEETKASKLLYDKVDSGRPPKAIVNDPTGLPALRVCFKDILYDKHGKKIHSRLPTYLERLRKEKSAMLVMPEPIPTTRTKTTDMPPAEMEDDGWKGYFNLDGSEMDVIQAINDFSLAAKIARQRSRVAAPPPPEPEPEPESPKIQDHRHHHHHHHHYRHRPGKSSKKYGKCPHGNLWRRRPTPEPENQTPHIRHHHHHPTAHNAMHTGPLSGSQYLPVRFVPQSVSGFPQSIQVTQLPTQLAFRPIAPRPQNSQTQPAVFLFPVQSNLRAIPVPQYLNQCVPPNQSSFSSPYASAAGAQARESNVRESNVRGERHPPLILQDRIYMRGVTARNTANPDSPYSTRSKGEPSGKNRKVKFADGDYDSDSTQDYMEDEDVNKDS